MTGNVRRRAGRAVEPPDEDKDILATLRKSFLHWGAFIVCALRLALTRSVAWVTLATLERGG